MKIDMTVTLQSSWDPEKMYRIVSKRIGYGPDAGEQYLRICYQSPGEPDPIKQYAMCWNVIFQVGGTDFQKWLMKFESKREAKLFCAFMEPSFPVLIETREWGETGFYELSVK